MKKNIPVCLFLIIIAALAGKAQNAGTDTSWVKNNYQKSETYIVMRDGVRLFTSIYTPKDTSQTYPILMQRTPYSAGPYGAASYRRRLGPNTH